MSDNSWYENGELPPVGSKCIVDSIDCRDNYARSFHGMEVDIHINMVDHQGDNIAVFSMIDPDDNDCLKFHGMMQHCFRPIKTEREIAIEAAVNATKETVWVEESVAKVAGILFDAGLLRSKNES